MFPADLLQKTDALLASCRSKGLLLATAESCTGGLLAALLTSIAGSSEVFERGFVTYSNRAKEDSLGVDPALLAHFGAVSAEVARAMAEGALAHSAAEIALSVTGIAGPAGGSTEKPVGLVYFGVGRRGAITTIERRFGDIGRTEVRLASIAVALDLLCEAVTKSK
ncbi:MAG: CinA family protein [Methylovirgula sp.]|jgi:nicotinamide-nucleotide amidase